MKQNLKPETLLALPLTIKQQVYFNYLIPVIITALIYILHFTSDFCLAIQHFRDGNELIGILTIFWIYLPAIGSFLVTLLNIRIWPKYFQCTCVNVKWFIIKLLQHFFIPVWAMYRFAEQLFWCIEAARCDNENTIEELLKHAERNSVFELYHFLQAYIQAAPQILFQINMIFQQPANYKKLTVDMQVFSIIMSLIKMAMTTMSYQRFKSQKLAGRQYPWHKVYTNPQIITILEENNEEDQEEKDEEEKEENNKSETEPENSEPEADRENEITVMRRDSGLSLTSSQFAEINRRQNGEDEPDFIIPLKFQNEYGLTGDDAAGKLISSCWWFCFLLARFLALSTFGYLYPKEMLWICSSHFVIALAFLMYDVHTSDVPYYRFAFLLFTAYIYMFCLIEFKIRFKKVKFIYHGYFVLVYLENFIITCFWYYGNEFDQDWWYKYIFTLLITSSLLSLISMLFYIFILKPKKVTISRTQRTTKLL